MAQQAEEPGPVFPQDWSHPAARHRTDDQRSDHNGEDRLDNVTENDHKGQSSSKHPVEIGQAGIAAAVVADIIVQNILGDDNRTVEAPQEVRYCRHHQKYSGQQEKALRDL